MGHAFQVNALFLSPNINQYRRSREFDVCVAIRSLDKGFINVQFRVPQIVNDAWPNRPQTTRVPSWRIFHIFLPIYSGGM